MQYNAPVVLPNPPKFHESSLLRSPRDSDNTARIWKRAKIINQALRSSQNATAQNARAIDKLRRRSLPSPPPSLQWQLPDKELDPTRAVSVGTLVCISPNNPLVTTGLKDLVSGSVTMSTPGTWCCVKNVPAQVTISSVVNYNVPVSPVPGAPGTPSGSPLAGDFDAANVFWVPIGTASSGGGNLLMYDTSGSTAYSNGQTVAVAAQFILSGVTVLPGTYQLIGSLSTPSSPTANQIPQIPVPISGTIYWWPIAAGLVQAGVCNVGGSAYVYLNGTVTF